MIRASVPAMKDSIAQRPEAKHVLNLARRDKKAAEAMLASLSLEDQVVVVCEAPLASRAKVLELSPKPEALIPQIPEAELCFTVKAVGIMDGSWILEHATPEQLVACGDLDAWSGISPDLESLGSWLSVFAEAGDATLVSAAQSLDAELWVLLFREMIFVDLKPNDDEGWQAPVGAQTLEGQFFFTAKRPSDDVAAIQQFLQSVFQADYWLYFRIMQGVMWEIDSDLEEWASRWRTGRLEDLGFPSWDESMRIYGYIRPDQRAEIPEQDIGLESTGADLPVWMPRLPATSESKHAVFRAAAELGPDERRSFFFGFIALSNKLAMADGLTLGDPETLPKSIEKVADLASAGLEFVAKEHGLGLADVVRRTSLERLFRVGANLDRNTANRDRTSYAEVLERQDRAAEDAEESAEEP
jgi:hypothetical protein